MGYHRAGYDVLGVDIWPEEASRTTYPFANRREDAPTTLARLAAGETLTFTDHPPLTLADIDALHASPPCQTYSITKHTHHNPHPDLLHVTRWLLRQTGKPYLIENVPGAPMDVPITLCGTGFGLLGHDTNHDPIYLRRHRLFEANWDLPTPPPCRCNAYDTRGLAKAAGVYGGGSENRNHAKYVRRGGYTPAKKIREQLMGIDWMTLRGLSQAIPPAYTHWLGQHLKEALTCSSPDPSATTTTSKP